MNQDKKERQVKEMYSVIKQNDNISAYVTEFIVDTEADIATLPTKDVFPGSTCIVAETSNVYILNSKKEWVKL